MAVPVDNNQTEGNMLEVERANTNSLPASSEGEGSSSEILSYTNGPQNSLFQRSPIFMPKTSSPNDYPTNRQSRESVLQRLSEALLRRSLAKASALDFNLL